MLQVEKNMFVVSRDSRYVDLVENPFANQMLTISFV